MWRLQLFQIMLLVALLAENCVNSGLFGGTSKPKPKPKPVPMSPDVAAAAAANPFAFPVESGENVEDLIMKQKKEEEEDGMEDEVVGGAKNKTKIKNKKDNGPVREMVEGSKEYDPIVPLAKNKTMRIAFCLTGQLARLELASKLKNIFLVNIQLGHTIHLYILLDDNLKDIHQTFWNYDYSKNPFAAFNKTRMEAYLDMKRKVYPELTTDRFKYFIRLEKPPQPYFQIVGGLIPVETKKIVNVAYEREHGLLGSGDGVEPAGQRFQNNMRWLAGLRECVKWMNAEEYQQKKFYDLVVRLRDDTLAFGKWKFYREKYMGALTSARVGSFRGVNDHNFAIDRVHADNLFRGLTEDYYFNNTFEKVMWGNPEHRIAQMAESLQIPIKNMTICEEPLIPLRGRHNDTHWVIHNQYRDNLLAECGNRKQRRKDNCICPPSWLRTLHYGTVAFDLKSPDSKGEKGEKVTVGGTQKRRRHL